MKVWPSAVPRAAFQQMPASPSREPCSALAAAITSAVVSGGALGIDSAARCGTEVRIVGNASRAMTNPAIVSRLSGGDLGSDVGLLANREEDLNNGNALLSARIVGRQLREAESEIQARLEQFELPLQSGVLE